LKMNRTVEGPCSNPQLFFFSSRYTQKNLLPRNVAMSVKAPELSTTISADEFHALEEKVYRTIELLKTAREGKAAAERDAARLRQQLEDREEEVETIRNQIVGLRKEREDVRGRVEKMLKQIDLLTEAESEA
jgi:septal ring factor EnvC (AmiA/AmiB activator)